MGEVGMGGIAGIDVAPSIASQPCGGRNWAVGAQAADCAISSVIMRMARAPEG